MRRRSYLQRVAAPLAPGDPALYTIRQAAPDEARPAAVAIGISKPVGSAAWGTVLRSSTYRTAETKGAAPVISHNEPALLPTPQNHPAASEGPDSAGAPPSESKITAPAGVLPSLASPGSAEIPMPPPGTGQFFAFEATRITAPGPDVPEIACETPVREDASTRAVRPFIAIDSTPIPTRDEIATPRPLRGVAASSDTMETDVRAAALPVRSDPLPAHVHIGTVEVRTSAPPSNPPAAAAPPPSAARTSAAAERPIARGYGWRFGLSQA